MPRWVIVVPGFSGSELRIGNAAGLPLWVNYGLLAIGQVGKLRLGPDGVGPGEPDGVACVPTGPLPSYYGTCVNVLTRQLQPDGYAVRQFGYDWRKRVIPNGESLAALVRSLGTSADPVTIVAHSLGGLVSRAAWASLVRSGETSLVRRLITLGTPHQGSYYAVELFSLSGIQLQQLVVLSQSSSVITASLNPLLQTPAWTLEQLSKLVATWPSIYEAFPVLGSPDSANDIHREAIYQPGGWPADRGISAELLGEARGSFRAFMLSSASFPPSTVLTTVSGIGFPTPSFLRSPAALGSSEALEIVGLGDGVVTSASALVPESAQFKLNVLHADLPAWTANNGQLRLWILDERTPPAPPPVLVVDTVSPVPVLAGPPVPYTLFPTKKLSCMPSLRNPTN